MSSARSLEQPSRRCVRHLWRSAEEAAKGTSHSPPIADFSEQHRSQAAPRECLEVEHMR